MKKLMMILAVIVLIGANFFGRSLMNAMADEPADPVKERYYKSITIKKGDNLWAIASQYNVDMDISIPAYVEELKKMNSLKEDTIHAGNHLIVAYLKKTD